MRNVWPKVFLAISLSIMVTGAGCSPLSSYVDLDAHRPLTRAERFFREGERLAALGEYAQATLAFRQAVQADPTYEPAIRQLAAAYQAEGRRRLATYYYEQLLALKPQDQSARQALTALYHVSGTSAGGNRLSTSWETFLEEQAVSGLALGGEVLYATTQGGSLYALAASDGGVRWRFAVAKPILSRPVYSPGPGQPLVLFGAEDNLLYALSVDGREQWHFAARAPIHGTPAVAGDSVYIGSTDGNLYALQRADGALRWQFATRGAIHAAPLVVGDTVYVGSLDQNLYALNARTGALRWHFAADDGIESTPAVQSQRLFVGANDSRLYCLHPTSGRELWRFSTGDAIYAQPLLADKMLYVASASQSLYAISPATGDLLWRYDVGGFLTTTPARDRGTLYLVASGDPRLHALDAATGRQLWTLDTGDWPVTEPVLANGQICLGEKDGTIVAYRLP